MYNFNNNRYNLWFLLVGLNSGLFNGMAMTSEDAQDAMVNARKNLFVLLCAQQGSISGGLTLDKANKSLMKLIFYIKTSYNNNLTSPKWKNFKGLKLQVTEKIRINNVIWRSWFEQCKFAYFFIRKLVIVFIYCWLSFFYVYS